MEWSGLGLETAVVGLNSNGDFFDNHLANGLSDIHQIIECSTDPEGRRKKRQTDDGNGGQTNQLPFDLTLQQARMQCNNFANADDNAFEDINTFVDLSDLPACDKTRVQLIDVGTSFQEFPQQSGDCYRSNNVLRATSPNNGEMFEFVSVCCYNDDG